MRRCLPGMILMVLLGAGCLDVDPDNDGLTTEEELALGSDPEDADTDDDGLPDNIDLASNTEPFSAMTAQTVAYEEPEVSR